MSCAILALVIRLLHKKTRATSFGRESIEAQNKLNKIMTGSHIFVTIGFTAAQVGLCFRTIKKEPVESYRMFTAFYFFGGVADLFLSVMLWFITDSNRSPAALLDGERVYPIIDVINTRNSVNSDDCDNADHEEADQNTSLADSSHSSGISKLMIDQFLNEVEDPDRDW